jgi:predicted NAD/FAD-dependent oxidoreductase
LAKVLAQDLPLALNQTVKGLRFENGLWHCDTAEGSVYVARHILVTCPLPQSAQFFAGSDSGLMERILALAEQVVYQGQWTLILSLSMTAARPKEFSAYEALTHPTIASLYHQASKGHLHSENLWVVQATQEFSHQHLADDAQRVGELLSHDLQSLGWDLTGASIQAHRWRYARVASPLKREFVKFENIRGLYLAGDFCLGSTVMAAAASGLAAAADLEIHRS